MRLGRSAGASQRRGLHNIAPFAGPRAGDASAKRSAGKTLAGTALAEDNEPGRGARLRRSRRRAGGWRALRALRALPELPFTYILKRTACPNPTRATTNGTERAARRTCRTHAGSYLGDRRAKLRGGWCGVLRAGQPHRDVVSRVCLCSSGPAAWCGAARQQCAVCTKLFAVSVLGQTPLSVHLRRPVGPHGARPASKCGSQALSGCAQRVKPCVRYVLVKAPSRRV